MQDILIVEDEPFFARLCQKTLAGPGRRIRVAGTGKEAQKELLQGEPDLLLLDLLLPVMDGFSLIEFLEQRNTNFPIIILSNLGDETGHPILSNRLPIVAYCVKSDTSLEKVAKLVEQSLAKTVS